MTKIEDIIVTIKDELEQWPDAALREALKLLKTKENSKINIVDVGAHYGETLVGIEAKINCNTNYLCLEPDKDTFAILCGVCDKSNNPRMTISPLCAAAGPVDGKVIFNQTKESAVSGILKPVKGLSERVPTGDHEIRNQLEVNQIKIDTLRKEYSFDIIDLLKIDAEGYDLEVLRGAESMLDKQAISVIVTEVFFVPYRDGQANFWDIAGYLNKKDYSFVNLFDTRDTKQGRLYTGNAIWVSGNVAKTNDFL
jgi:FkbM family methyltransferase